MDCTEDVGSQVTECGDVVVWELGWEAGDDEGDVFAVVVNVR